MNDRLNRYRNCLKEIDEEIIHVDSGTCTICNSPFNNGTKTKSYQFCDDCLTFLLLSKWKDWRIINNK